jgi:hypothetical protein
VLTTRSSRARARLKARLELEVAGAGSRARLFCSLIPDPCLPIFSPASSIHPLERRWSSDFRPWRTRCGRDHLSLHGDGGRLAKQPSKRPPVLASFFHSRRPFLLLQLTISLEPGDVGVRNSREMGGGVVFGRRYV